MNPDDQSPRDWLLTRHSAATPKLDALRRATLENLPPSPRDRSMRELLTEFFHPHRHAWRLLAAAWLGLLALHLSTSTPLPPTGTSRLSPEQVAAWIGQHNSHATLAQTDR